MKKKINTNLLFLFSGVLFSANNLFASSIIDLRDLSHSKNISAKSSNLSIVSLESQDVKLEKITELKDANNNTHIKYQQKYKGIPVLGKNIFTHKNSQKTSKQKYTGQMISGIENDVLDVNPNFDAKTALDIANKINLQDKYGASIQSLNKNNFIYENENTLLVIYNNTTNHKASLAYKVSFFIDNKQTADPSRPYYIIDAKTKEVIKKWDGLTFNKIATGPGGNDKIGRYEYGVDYPEMDVRQTARNYCFFTNEKVKTIDLERKYYDIKDHTFKYECTRHEGDEINGAASPLNDAHYFGNVIFDMYKDWYDTSPLNFKLKMRVHYGEKYENAFWNGSAMTFGDGDRYFYPLVSLDVAAHEVSHGFTEHNSNLEYVGQSGGMNESFSDMAGKAAEYYARGKNTWGIGEDITKFSMPLRYMDSPELDGNSIGDARDYVDGLDVHYSSGVYNKVFAMLSMTKGWDTKMAFDVFVHANRYYWHPTTDYISGAIDTINSSEDLDYDVQDVVDVFAKVGIGCSVDTCSIIERSSDDQSSELDDDDIDLDDDESSFK